MLASLRRLWGRRPGAQKIGDELTNDVRSALAEADDRVAAIVASGGAEYVPFLADIRALAKRPAAASLLEAVADLHRAFPYREDKGQTWVERDDAKFLARLRAAGVGYTNTTHSPGRGGDVVHRLHYRVARALRLAAHAGPRSSAQRPGERIVDVGRHRMHFFEPEHGGGFAIDEGWYVPVGYGVDATRYAW